MPERSPRMHPPVAQAVEPHTHARSMTSERHDGLTQLAAEIAASPRMVAQRKQMGGLAVPRPGKVEKVPVQGKFDGALSKGSPRKKTVQKMAAQRKGEHEKKSLQKRVRSTLPTKAGLPINDDPSLETEADVMGAKAAAIGANVAQRVNAEGLGLTAHRALMAGTASSQSLVQRTMDFTDGTDYLNPNGAGKDIALEGYRKTIHEAIDMKYRVVVSQGDVAVGIAQYQFDDPDELSRGGKIMVKKITDKDLQDETEEYNSRLIAMAHETRHGIDDLNKHVKYRKAKTEEKTKENRLHTEWRAFATHAAVALQLAQEGKQVEDRYKNDVASYASKDAFMNSKSSMFGATATYLQVYGINKAPLDRDVRTFMESHESWIIEAIALHQSLRPRQISRQAAQNLRPANVAPADWFSGQSAWILAGAVALGLAAYFGLTS